MTLSYQDFALEHYLNTRPVGTLAGENVFLADVGTAVVFAGLNAILPGAKSTGKTQFMRDILNGYYGGSKHALWEMGRSDYKPRELFERLNISLAKGQINRFPAVRNLLDKDGQTTRHFVESLDDFNGEALRTSWRELSPDELEKLIDKYSITTEQLAQLSNVDKRFFCIDEYNRCPPVVMNLFYGLMTGEFNHQGKIVRLGRKGGVYSGMAAVNLGYEGTFEMDPAMWARFHIVLDFNAYRPSVRDLDELNLRALSPDVQDSQKRDITSAIERINQRIQSQKPTIKERLILQYFQSGLGYCSVKKSGKDLLDWPRVCSHDKGCKRLSKLCGMVQGLDARAIRAVFKLVKGLEEVLRLKKGDTLPEEKEGNGKGEEQSRIVNPLESFALAYKFVVPYKGCFDPQKVKEARGIEALVAEEYIPAIQTELELMLDSLDKYTTAVKSAGGKRTANLEKCFKDLGQKKEYDRIVAEIETEYTVTRALTPEEFIAEEPGLFNEMLMKSLRERVSQERKAYEEKFLSSTVLNKILQERLTSLRERIDRAAAGAAEQEQLQRTYSTSLDTAWGEYLQAIETPEDARQFFGVEPETIETVSNMVKKSLPQKEMSYIPQDKKGACELKKKALLQKKLEEITKETMETARKSLVKDEKFFVGHFVEEYVGGGK